jgi:hypothetical protein
MYSIDNVEIHRPSPLADKEILAEIQKVLSGNIDQDISDQVYVDFLKECEQYIFSSKLNNLSGYESFKRKDIMIGCTQFIDNLYMQGPVQTITGDYKYHERLGKTPVEVSKLKSYVPLIISMPFPSTGDKLPNMEELLDMCAECHIPVHIDGAWITCSKDIDFNFDHPAIQSFGISLSKGLGLGWNRVGIRWHRNPEVKDSISIMNDFRMNLRAVVKIGLHFIRRFPVDYLWNKHRNRNEKICKDFCFTPTNSIHLVIGKHGELYGISKLINALDEEHNAIQ